MANRGKVYASPYNGARAAVTYNLTGPTSGSTIQASDISSIRTILNQELTRRGLSTIPNSATSGSTITASFINSFNSNLNRTSTVDPPRIAVSVSGSEGNVVNGQYNDPLFSNGWLFDVSGTWIANDPPAFSVPASSVTTVSAGDNITSSRITDIINDIKTAGQACLCNCNYCTCNCNYCTCNCNYSCTCNCNYSDRRLKRNIKFIKNILGINVYTFNYFWNNEKQIGVMAQELLNTKYKSCVTKDKNGFFMVDYSKLPFSLT
jgi:hypothetical protein